MKNGTRVSPGLLVAGFLLCVIFSSAVLYRHAFSAYFFQDDWFSLRMSNVSSVSGFLSFFIPRQDVIYYRPFGMQVPYVILQKLFGLWAFPYHLWTFLFHAVNIVLVFAIVSMMTKHRHAAYFGAFLYGLSIVHYTPMYWTATTAFLMGPTMGLTSFFFFLRFLSDRRDRWYAWSIIFFLLGLLTNEITAVIPLMTSLYLVFHGLGLNRLIKVIPFFALAGVLFFLRFVVFPPPLSGSYEQGFGISTIHNLKGYVLWSLQWPEEISVQFTHFFTLNPLFVRDFLPFLTGQFIATVIFCLGAAYLIVGACASGGWKQMARIMAFSFFWFVTGLLPVIFFIGHSFSYYLPLSLLGILYPVLYSIARTSKSFCTTVVVVSMGAAWVYAGMNTDAFNRKVHWIPRRAQQSEMLVKKALQLYPRVSLVHDPVLYVSPSSENKLSINDQDGFAVLYGMPELVTKYESTGEKETL